MVDHKVWWKCSVDPTHEWQATRSDRLAGEGCPFCSGKKACATNNLVVTHPDIAGQWHPDNNGQLTADQVLSTSGRVVWWKCDSGGHEWKGSPRDFVAEGCPQCPSEIVLTPELQAEFSDRND